MPDNTRITGLDLMKVLGLYLVVLYHLTFRNLTGMETAGGKFYAVYGLGSAMSICVPLFFTASGALSLPRSPELRKNTRRCVHLALLLAFWSVLSLAAVLVLRQERMGVREFLQNLTYLTNGYIQHLWYLGTFLFMNLLLPALQTLRRSSRQVFRYGLAVLVLFTFGNVLLNDLEYLLRWVLGRYGYTGTRQFFGNVNHFGGYYWYPIAYMALGAALLERREDRKRWRGAAAAAIPLSILALMVCGIARCRVQGAYSDPIFRNYGSVFTLVLTAAVSLLLLELRPPAWVRRVSASISSCSLGVYFLHWLLVEAERRFLPGLFAKTALAPLTALGILGLSWGITWAALRVPVLRNLFTASPAWVRRGRDKA